MKDKPWQRVGQTRNQWTKNLATKNYPPIVLMEPCHHCGAPPFKLCRRTNNSGIVISEPHAERVRMANLKLE